MREMLVVGWVKPGNGAVELGGHVAGMLCSGGAVEMGEEIGEKVLTEVACGLRPGRPEKGG